MPSLACPACGAIYRVPDSAIGRQLKCAKCAHQWRAEAGRMLAPFSRAVAAFAPPPPGAPPLAAPPLAAPPLAAPTVAAALAVGPAAPSPAALGPVTRRPAPEDDILAQPFEPAPRRPIGAVRRAEAAADSPPGAPIRGTLRGGAPLAAASRPPRGGLALTLAWAASLAALAGGLYALAAYRAELAQAWPPFQRLVGWFGG